MMSLSLNADQISFSRRETNYAINRNFHPNLQPLGSVVLRHIYGGKRGVIFELNATRGGQPVDAQLSMTPDTFTLREGDGRIEFIMPEPNVIRIRTRGLGLRMAGRGPDWSLLVPAGGDRWRSIIGESKLLWVPLRGGLNVTSTWRPKEGQHHRHHGCSPMIVDLPADAELLLLGYQSEMLPPEVDAPVMRESFDDARARVAADFRGWLDASPPAPEEYADARATAAYIAWSSVVPAEGNYHAPTMLMSKNWMVNTWNWDNYFNAWASTYRDPEFAWQQFMLHIRHQHETGALGDAINQQTIGWSYTKPPVHGWILKRMMQISDAIDDAKLRAVYEPLCRWTQWWFTYRDDDDDGICQYHHGNDSGWDDATAFDIGSPTETPDLNALLVLQMEVLGEIASRLGQHEDATRWQQRSDAMLATFLDHSWRDGRFVSMESGTHRFGGPGDSLLNFIPLVLGHRLPPDKLDAMVEGLMRTGRFLTDWGLATEAVDSPEFLAEGYWRGAIWPPPMMMIIDGLADAGRHDLARDLAQRFCRMCATHGFGENHNARTGVIHYDPAYTWSTSVWQVLVADHLKP